MKNRFVLFSFLLLSCFSARSQSVDSMMQVYSEQFPDQKVHVHFDKDLYRAGETIWFKAYLFSGFSLSAFSKTFYAELVDNKGAVVQRKVYPVVESTAAGNFDLPDSMPGGNLLYRGYTTWNLNFDTSFIFQKNIAVTDKAGISGKASSPALPVTTSVSFFPEGGNLVNGLESVVAFKANDDLGMPVFVKGNVVNSKNEVITSFSAAHDGMGIFKLTPQAGETYKAVWTETGGKQQTTDLPVAKEQGFVLRISAAAGKKVFAVTRTENVPDSWKKINIVAMLGQERVYEAHASLETSKITSGAIPVEGIPSGLMQIIVFSENWEPVTERIVMVNNGNYRFGANVNTPELNTNFRAKNTFEIQVEDTLLSNMSIAITDAATGRQNYGDNIVSRVLMTGDLRGYVYNPSYYFTNESDSVAANLDLVMLTHGWRRYNWSDLVKGKKPRLKYLADGYLSLEAKVFGVTTASPLRGDEQLLIFIEGKDSSRQFIQMPKTGVDKFSVPNLVFYDTASVYYQFMKDKKADKEMSLAFNNNFYKGVKRIAFADRPLRLDIDTSILARTKFLAGKISQYGSSFTQGNVLQTVTVRTRVKSRLQELDEKYASGLFRGDDGYIFDLTADNVSGAFDILSYLQGRVAGLQISGTGANANISWRGSPTSLFLNEMQADVSMISTINVADIAYVKVIRPPFMGATGGGAGGAVAVYTKKGNDVKPTPGTGLNKSLVLGYSSPKEFYSPNYKDLSASAEVAADYRSTLYWNPAILTDASRQKVKIEFYNNDITRAFRVVLEGVNEIGKIVRIEKVIQQAK